MTTTAETLTADGAAPAEPAPPAESSRAPFARRLLLPLLLAFGIRVIFGVIDDVPSVDETTYLSSGLSWWEGNGYRIDNKPALHFPPLVPFLLGGVAEITGDAHEAQVVVTIITGTLILLPMAGIARAIAGDRAGVAAAWVGAVATSLVAEVTIRGGGSEAPYTLVVLTALWLVTKIRPGPFRRNLGFSAAAGLVTGLAYLTRPEGLWFGGLFAAAIALRVGLGWRGLVRPWSWHNIRRGIAAGGLFMVVLLGVAAPYVSYLHDKTGKWTLTAKTQDASLAAWQAVAEGDRRARDEILYALDDSGVQFSAERYSLVKLMTDDPAGYSKLALTNVRQLGYYLFVPDHDMVWYWRLLPAPLVLFAGWVAWRKRRDPTAMVVTLTVLIPVSTALAFFVLGRYLVVSAALMYVLCAVGFAELSQRWRRPAGWATMAFLLYAAFAALWSPAGFMKPREPIEQRLAGEWIHDHVPEDARIMTRSQVVAFYADRSTVALPYASPERIMAFARHWGAEYVVADEFILWEWRPQLRYLFGPGPYPGLKLVHEVEREGRLVRVFAFDPPVEPSKTRNLPGLAHQGDGSPVAEESTEDDTTTTTVPETTTTTTTTTPPAP